MKESEREKSTSAAAERTTGESPRAGSRLRELGVVLQAPPSPLGAYVETSRAGSLLFVSGTLPLVDRKLAISGRIGKDLSVNRGQEAARLAALNALAAAKEYVGDLDKIKKIGKIHSPVSNHRRF